MVLVCSPAVAAAALCLAFSPKVNSVTFTPKFAVVLLFAAVGIVPLARLVRPASPLRWPARAAVAFLAVALVSALVSPSPHIGFFGLYLWGTGWLFWLGAAGAFAIGASLDPKDRRWLVAGLLVGSAGNALVAIFQIVNNPSSPGLVLFDGRQADGFLGNPIHLEALLLGGLALVLGRACRSPLRWGVLVLVLAVGLEFTFERFAFGVLVLLVLYALYTYGASSRWDVHVAHCGRLRHCLPGRWLRPRLASRPREPPRPLSAYGCECGCKVRTTCCITPCWVLAQVSSGPRWTRPRRFRSTSTCWLARSLPTVTTSSSRSP